MFARSHSASPKSVTPDASPLVGFRSLPGPSAGSGEPATPPPVPQAAVARFSAGSIIGNDLTIMGQGLRIVSKGTLQVDGRVEGDVAGREVIIGEKGHVAGIVSGESVVVRGAVQGTIRAGAVALQSSARVEGDVHHGSLSVEQGAQLEGRIRRPQDPSELTPDLGGEARGPATA